MANHSSHNQLTKFVYPPRSLPLNSADCSADIHLLHNKTSSPCNGNCDPRTTPESESNKGSFCYILALRDATLVRVFAENCEHARSSPNRNSGKAAMRVPKFLDFLMGVGNRTQHIHCEICAYLSLAACTACKRWLHTTTTARTSKMKTVIERTFVSGMRT